MRKKERKKAGNTGTLEQNGIRKMKGDSCLVYIALNSRMIND